MNRKFYIYLAVIFAFGGIIIFTSSVTVAQPGWYWQNPVPQGNSLYCMSFLNSNIGVAAGEFGTIIRTTNGGLNWSVVTTNRRFYLRSIAYPCSNIILVLATEPSVYGSNIILRSIDDGKTWQEHLLGNAKQYYAMFCIDSLNGTVVGAQGTILKTTDGGQTWNTQASGTVSDLHGVHFCNSQNGFSVGDYGTIIRTTNGGETWSTQPSPTDAILWGVSCVDSTTAWICGRGSTILRTTDGGASWQKKYSGTYYDLYSISSTSENVIVAVGRNEFGGNTISSIDGGTIWKDTTNGPDVFQSVTFIDSSTVLAVGDVGTIYRSNNSGIDWAPIVKKIESGYYDVRFVNENIGMIAGANGVILRTQDGGANWIKQSTGLPTDIYAVDLIDTSIATAVGSSGYILRTTNSGQSWTTQMSGQYDWLADVDYLNGSVGMVTGENGLILKTTNGGQSWTELTSGTIFQLTGIKMLSSSIAIAVGQGYCCPINGIILRTTNGGTSWSVVLIGDTVGGLSDVDFSTLQNGVAVGSKILRTTNGGLTWYSVPNDSPAVIALSSVSFGDQSDGFAVGSNGIILRTTSGGAHWKSQVSNTGRILYGVSSQRSEKAVAVGEHSTILRTVTGGDITGVGSPPGSRTLPQQIILAQSYPNPFNPVTIIEYDLPVTTHVRITVFDMLGREISTLVDEFQHAGRNSVKFAAEHLPSGIYFYRLAAGTFIETKKLVLLK